MSVNALAGLKNNAAYGQSLRRLVSSTPVAGARPPPEQLTWH